MHSTRVVAQSQLEVDDPFKFRLTLYSYRTFVVQTYEEQNEIILSLLPIL